MKVEVTLTAVTPSIRVSRSITVGAPAMLVLTATKPPRLRACVETLPCVLGRLDGGVSRERAGVRPPQ